MLLIRVDGEPAVLESQIEKIANVCRELGAMELRIASNQADGGQDLGSPPRLSQCAYRVAIVPLQRRSAAPINRLLRNCTCSRSSARSTT
jgi:hypothetical protein